MKDSEKYNYDDNESTVDLINYDRIERDQFSDDFFQNRIWRLVTTYYISS